MTREQCQAARALLGWNAEELAAAAGIGVATVWRFESGESVRSSSTEAMKIALEKGGIEFIDKNGGGEGVRRRS